MFVIMPLLAVVYPLRVFETLITGIAFSLNQAKSTVLAYNPRCLGMLLLLRSNEQIPGNVSSKPAGPPSDSTTGSHDHTCFP